MVDLAQAPSSQPLFSKTLRVESKTIFVDVKENANGMYLKIAERSTRGERQTIVMAVSGIRQLREALDEALEQLNSTQVLRFTLSRATSQFPLILPSLSPYYFCFYPS